MNLTSSDVKHLNLVGWGVVQRRGNGKWECADDPSQHIDGRTLAKLERLGLVRGASIGTTASQAVVRVTLTEEGEKIVDQL